MVLRSGKTLQLATLFRVTLLLAIASAACNTDANDALTTETAASGAEAVSANVADSEGAGSRAAPRTIFWGDLAPGNGKPYSDPFAKLTRDQLSELSHVMRVRQLIADEKISADGEDAKEATQLASKLQRQGIDIAWLVVQRDRVQQIRGLQVQQVAKSIGDSLRDQIVSLSGYVIPAKADNEGRLREFFLVPTPAACSHEDPPPRLKVVFVSTKQGIVAPGKRNPVRVTGKIVAETTSRTTVNASGRLRVHSAYAMSSPEITVLHPSSASNNSSKL